MTGQRLITDILQSFNWFVLIRLEYLFGYFLLPLFGLFAVTLLENHIYPIIQKKLFQILLASSSLLVLMPNSVYTAVLLPYKLFSVLYLLYVTAVIIKAVINSRPSAAIMLFAVSGIIVYTYGHKIGDFVLQETGRRLKSLLRSTDIICRYGGDEFVIILNGGMEEIKNIAGKIIRTIQEPYKKDGNSYNISVSIGITKLDSYTENLETSFRLQ